MHNQLINIRNSPCDLEHDLCTKIGRFWLCCCHWGICVQTHVYKQNLFIAKNWFWCFKVEVLHSDVRSLTLLTYIAAPSAQPPNTKGEDEPWEEEVDDLVNWSSKLDSEAIDGVWYNAQSIRYFTQSANHPLYILQEKIMWKCSFKLVHVINTCFSKTSLSSIEICHRIQCIFHFLSMVCPLICQFVWRFSLKMLLALFLSSAGTLLDIWKCAPNICYWSDILSTLEPWNFH